ncbi:ABC transporter ATP-binding protein [Anaerofustis stercorihominis]|uniref:ABC transporter, ATP-binding protein n=1 Tax=Anaerofustis stercorihominis DSM 17244 TaxID=445971 RepID=B1C683_9FIRM|nr:ABC transporter ATP-binding protein [Anaerofustis stercorihominis]EDS73368.1 ABC transporter, ATP-binding protein [Anaerofustis stercorihominis DSM 17244]MCQ4794820.1 ABC transporter ATP-binding protein [Anaerofustis stercorihominis]
MTKKFTRNSVDVKVEITEDIKKALNEDWPDKIPEENIAVSVNNVTKMYKIYKKAWHRIINAFSSKINYGEFYALKDINIKFPKGETIGILGVNGSGKSTLLKMITGVVKPTSGTIDVKGRISAMLELTSGFDKELTGYENILLKATTLGIPLDEMEQRVPAIIEFADIGDHLYQPVRTYSSGMKSRLGFAISANVNPDILIVDEVLAVGDDTFKLKCLSKMEEFRKEGKTILFVSHSLFTIKGFCTKAMWIKDGELIAKGETAMVTKLYEDYLKEIRTAKRIKAREEQGNQEEILEKKDILEFIKTRMLDININNRNRINFNYGSTVIIEIEYEVKKPIENDLICCFSIRDIEEREVFATNKQNKDNIVDSSIGRHIFRFILPNLRLLPGNYKIAGEFWNNEAGLHFKFASLRRLNIVSNEYKGGGVYAIPYKTMRDDYLIEEREQEGTLDSIKDMLV